MNEPIEISGAGPSGLAAAITIARAGRHAVVYERRPEVGARFHGDFQGIENWSVTEDVLKEFESIGIDVSFDYTAFRQHTVFDSSKKQHVCRSRDPLFYLVRRGPVGATLDQALKAQALSLGVEIRFNHPMDHLPRGGIVAVGPHRADAIATGYISESALPDGAYGALSESLAPRGYAYLLVHDGRATMATCLFEDFHNERLYLDRTVEFFRQTVGFELTNAHRFGGAVNFSIPRTARRGLSVIAGEAAGFQDAAWGFGMRFAILSGHLAALALLDGRTSSYDRAWRRQLSGVMKASFFNRLVYTQFGDAGYGALARRMARAKDGRQWLHSCAKARWWKSLAASIACRASRRAKRRTACPRAECDCTWCRCQRELTEG